MFLDSFQVTASIFVAIPAVWLRQQGYIVTDIKPGCDLINGSILLLGKIATGIDIILQKMRSSSITDYKITRELQRSEAY